MMTAYAITLGLVSLVFVCWQWADSLDNSPRMPRARLRQLRRNRADLRRALGRK